MEQFLNAVMPYYFIFPLLAMFFGILIIFDNGRK